MSEHLHQVALIAWARAVEARYPGLDLLEASLNGVKLSKAQAGKAKAAGLLTGALDLNLPVARGGYFGMRIELKYGRNKLTTEQQWHTRRLTEEGWLAIACWNWLAARDAIVDYLTSPPTARVFAPTGSKPPP